MKRMFLFAGLLVIVLSACGAGPKAITEGTMRDTIFSIEPRQNGTTTIWITHDDVGAYCTLDKDLVATAYTILMSANPEAIITYRSVNNDDPEYAWLGDATGAGCAKEKGKDNSITIYKLLTIQAVESLDLSLLPE